MTDSLIKWYDKNKRDLPWRQKSSAPSDPYPVWLSEIMLQQTTVATVKAYFLKFIEKWPTVQDLAQADLDEILHAWQGLGYYSRARNLHRCAQEIIQTHGGHFPSNEQDLLKLPGVGPYTAAALTTIAFQKPAAVVDGNVERIISRRYAITTALPQSRPQIKAKVADLTPHTRPGDFAQAMMDLGATVCTPKNPSCLLCPWNSCCQAIKEKDPCRYPIKVPKPKRPTRQASIFWVCHKTAEKTFVLLRKRPPKGLLGGLIEIPSSAWINKEEYDEKSALKEAPFKTKWIKSDQKIAHTFTHFHLELTIYQGVLTTASNHESCFWWPVDDLDSLAFPTVMKKVIQAAS